MIAGLFSYPSHGWWMMNPMRSKATHRQLAMTAIVLGACGLITGVAIVASQTTGDPGENCYQWQTPPEGLDPSPEAQFGGQGISYWPLGMSCQWTMADGSHYEQPNSNPLPTILVYGGALVGSLGPLVIAGADRQKGR